VRAVVAKREKGLTAKRMETLVRQNVSVAKATVYTDQFVAYFGLSRFVKHGSVDHTVCYANGEIHTNSIESFWALLKRGIVGQYHQVSVRHLPQYLNEFCYRFNNRTNANVFDVTLCRALGV
jgi:transposase-like protein